MTPRQANNTTTNNSSSSSSSKLNGTPTCGKKEEPPPMRDFFFLSDEAADSLAKYEYQGEDKSLLYHYILSPLAAFLVNRCTPHTIAPNTITLVGLTFMFSSYLLEWYYNPHFQRTSTTTTSIPSFIFLFNCASMLIYQTLDNMDGKQARRTKSSSPLGLLFDHGCDAANSMFGSANWIIAIGLSLENDLFQCWILVLGPMALFYIATWEEYYTGKLILPIMNGPNEGLVLGALTSFATYLYGVSYWQTTSWNDSILQPYILPMLPTVMRNVIPTKMTNAEIQVCMATFGFVQETCSKSMWVAYKYGLKSVWELLPFFTLCVSTLWIGMVQPDIFVNMPRTTLHLISGLFVEMCAQLMLNHISHSPFQPFRWVLLPLCILTLLVALNMVQHGEYTNEFLMIYASALWAFLLFKMTLVIHEICAVLRIWCFDICTPRHARPPPLCRNDHSSEKLH